MTAKDYYCFKRSVSNIFEVHFFNLGINYTNFKPNSDNNDFFVNSATMIAGVAASQHAHTSRA